MYKKIIGIAVVAAMATGVYFVANTEDNDDNNVDLSALLKVNNANAECFPFQGEKGACFGVGTSGTCLIFNALDCDGTQP